MPGAEQIADTLLRLNGGRTVFLRIPQPPIAGDDAEQLGLSTPVFNDLELAPAVFRPLANTCTLLVSATAVNTVTQTLGIDSGEALFRSATAVVIDDAPYTITRILAEQAFGRAFCYTLTLQP